MKNNDEQVPSSALVQYFSNLGYDREMEDKYKEGRGSGGDEEAEIEMRV